MSRPSMTRRVALGVGAAASGAAMVGSRSIVIAGTSRTTPFGMRPGHRATNGTRTPPSNVVPFPSRNGPAEPA